MADAQTLNPADTVTRVRAYLVGLQARITDALESVEGEGGARFLADAWSKPPGEPLQGDGITKIMEGGRVFERAGCGFSHVRGPQLPPSATQHRPELAGAPFEAMGVSLVFHPRNPYVPTVHMNVRMIAAGHPGQAPTCWFGGGMDLTPYYGFEEDAVHFHRTCRDALAPFGDDKYPRFKQWCDEYFYLKHRSEQRGVGGVFYDDFSELGFEQSLAMTQSVGDAFLSAYLPIVEKRQGMAYGERERDFRCTAGAAMSSSTWCGIGARTLACSRAGAPSPFCCPCRRWYRGPTSALMRPIRPKPSSRSAFWCGATGLRRALSLRPESREKRKSYNFNSCQRFSHERKRPKTPHTAAAPQHNTRATPKAQPAGCALRCTLY